ncbi:hypothetical protein Bca52824_079938 [Brassica carinata]|uniref:Legume lectin domain-containing protein n=1 Tax=Brassica carinata TaxID=52824 RepID=A0A8X7PYD0_BRACI|nr:hypothetical protein Bca52824_079938 [Brassica carinata]
MAIPSKSVALTIIIQLCLVSCMSSQQQETEFLHHGFSKPIYSIRILQDPPKWHLGANKQLKETNGSSLPWLPIPFNNPNNSSNSLSFSTSFVFSINAPGHGLTFMISPSMDFTRAMPSQFLGLFNSSNNGNSTNRILAVEFDTVKSNEFLDIDGNHVGIDLNGLVSVESAPAALKLSSTDPIRAWIEYNGEEMLLNVTLAPLDISKPKFPLLSRKMNLSETFNEKMYVGFSASTGNISSDHYVIGWSFSREGKAKDFDLTLLPSVSPSDSDEFDPISSPSDSGTLNSKLTKLIIVCAFAAMLFII